MAVWRDDAWARRRARRVRLALAVVAVVAALLSWRVDPSEPVTVAVAMSAPSAAVDFQWAGSAAVHGEPSASTRGERLPANDSATGEIVVATPVALERDASGTERCPGEQVLAALRGVNALQWLDREDPVVRHALLQLADELQGRSDAERAVGLLLRDQLTRPAYFREITRYTAQHCPDSSEWSLTCRSEARAAVESQRLHRLNGLLALALTSTDPAAVGVAAGALCAQGFVDTPIPFRSACQALASRWISLSPDEAYPRVLLAQFSHTPTLSGGQDDAWVEQASRTATWSRLDSEPGHVLSRSALFATLDSAVGVLALQTVVANRPALTGLSFGSTAGVVVGWCSATAAGATQEHQASCQNLARLMDSSHDAILMVHERRRLGVILGIDDVQQRRLDDEALAYMRLQRLPDPATLARLQTAVVAECRKAHDEVLRVLARHETQAAHDLFAARAGHTEAFQRAVAASGRSVEQLAAEQCAELEARLKRGKAATP